ncbi:MAG: sigma 54-interacting transcriptional regulator [Desulfobacteraceae bacterium]|nr:sigma 54-interacting transcriptional regulator [Desulfobacteraceae bacterium]
MQSLRSKLLLAVSALVIASGLLISLLVTQRYSTSLFEAAKAQAENLAHAMALDATDKILINDLVALQKMLDDKISSNPTVAYLFINRDGQLLAHTFTGGFPVELTNANRVVEGDNGRFQEIASTTGELYLDIAWPIFSGKAGVLRLGFSEKPIKRQIMKLWLQMSVLTLVILLCALTVSFLFIKRVTEPLSALSEAVENIDEDHLEVGIEVKGHDEVGKLASSFNQMIARIKKYTLQLKENAVQLNRAHNQTRSCLVIAQDIGALGNLNEVGSYLIRKFQEILACKEMVLLIFTDSSEILFTLSDKTSRTLGKESLETVVAALGGLKKTTFVSKDILKPPLVPGTFSAAKHLATFPVRRDKQLLGAMIVSCPGNCICEIKDMELLELILNQASGALKRAAVQEEEIRNLHSRIETVTEFSGIIGKDPKMQKIYKLIEDIAPTDASILIEGESGTGKELVANAIHYLSLRKDKPFVVINCSAYPSTLLESEIFGHEKGAFTGAIRQKAGRFEQAHGGTVFLDEIGEISPSAQIKLLRVLQSQKFERIGAEKTLSVDLRVLTATNKDLLEEVKNGNFREDLYYRLNVIPIYLPLLRERSNDIPLLSQHFLVRFSLEQGKDINGFTSDALRLLLDYPWPGNVRELENSIEHATVLAKGDRIEVSDLPPAIRNFDASFAVESPGTIQENEKIMLAEALEECNWNKKMAAQRLGISRATLYNKLRKYQIFKHTIH